MHWKVTTTLICAYGIVKEFRPATPFLTPYLVSSFKNFTDVELYSEIYPFWTYAYLFALVPIFFLTDILRYKPIVMLEAFSLCGTWALLLWGQTLWQMQVMQIIFGISSASEIAYFSYMYAVVDQKRYKLVTSYIRAAALVGKFFAFGLSQFLISFEYGSYLSLNQISFGSVCTVLVIAAFLPPIPSKIIKNKIENENSGLKIYGISRKYEDETSKEEDSEEKRALDAKPLNIDYGLSAYFRAVWYHMKIFKRDRAVLKWSIWWALASCGIFQVMNYVQTLWATMQTSSDTYNGLTECANTLIGALISFVVQYINVNWIAYGEHILFVTSAVIAILLIVLSYTKMVHISYVVYIVIITIYNFLITVASSNIATKLDSASYGLIFGWNTFSALVLQALLTLAVADKHGFSLSIRDQKQADTATFQFFVYGCYFVVVGLIFAAAITYKSVKYECCRSSHRETAPVDRHISSPTSVS
ncbi:unnamed protein product [Thelazia callipaeda]|uniref:Thiamine transporter 2 n=1 Tax=Thelazia callipaeda TaxID=103827 RepID=A0A0N5CRF4_THECL|nr:unnamed protein product [Thelazia callipaeda]